MRKSISPFVLAGLILLIVGCPSPSSSGSSNSNSNSNSSSGGSVSGDGSLARGGSLTIKLPAIQMQDANAKTPDLSITTSYDVSGSGPGNATFLKPGITAETVTIDSLAPGDWGVNVNGNNQNGSKIASASLSVTVAEGLTVSQDFTNTSWSVANGNLELSLEWPVSRGISSAIVSLTPEGGVPLQVTLQPVATTKGGLSVSATAAVPPGYYTLSRVFSDGTGGADAVQITSGSTTKFVLSVVSGMDLTITPDISKVIPINFTYVGQGSVMTVTAAPTPSKQYNSFTYQWYLNGAPLAGETGDTITLLAKYRSYRLDCVVASNGALSSSIVPFFVN
jgi:hypothetical protein